MSAAVTTLPRRAWVEEVMGIPMNPPAWGRSGHPEAADAVAAAFASLREMDRIFSTWRDYSDIMRLRRGELTIEECHPLVAEALDIGSEATRSPAARSRRCCPETRETSSSTPPAWSRAGRSSARPRSSPTCPASPRA